MTRRPLARLALYVLIVLSATVTPAGTQTLDPRAAQVEAAIAANSSNAALQQCLKGDPAIERYRYATNDLINVAKPNFPAPFNCSGIGASWQEVAPAACCSAFERDKAKNIDAAWIALQQCGMQDRIAKRRPAFLAAAEKCFAASGVAIAAAPKPATPAVAADSPWKDLPAFQAIRDQIIGKDAFAILGGEQLRVFDNAARVKDLPGFLADRVQSGHAILDDRAWLQAAFASFATNTSFDDFLASMARAASEAGKEYVWFGDEFLKHQLPNTSIRTTGGQFCSSEHGSVRGTINGTGDFIYCPLWEELKVPMGSERTYWDTFGETFLKSFLPVETFEQLSRDIRTDIASASTPRFGIRLASWRMVEAIPVEHIRIELPSARVTSDDPMPIVITDLAPSGAAAVMVLAGRVRITETKTGMSTLASRGQSVLVWPGNGVSKPTAVSAARWAAVAKPRMRGSITLKPGDQWSGTLQLHDLLTIEGRLLSGTLSDSPKALGVTINGQTLAASDAKINPTQPYRYVWDIASQLRGNRTAQVEFRNVLASGGGTLEVKLLPTDLYELVERARSATTTREMGGKVSPTIPFGEPTITGRISNIVTAHDVRGGAAVDISDVFAPDVNPIHVWFRLSGFAPGTTLHSRWTYLGGSAPLVIGAGDFTTVPTNNYGTFNYELAPGKRWPAGEYRIEILLGNTVIGTAMFEVRGTTGARE